MQQIHVSHVTWRERTLRLKNGRTMNDYEKVAHDTQKKPRVLIIDDNPKYAHLFELIAERLGIAVLVVNSCEEGLKKLQEQKFDVVMMDWLMPEVDGLACTKKIRFIESSDVTNKRITVIGVSGYIDATRSACLEAGMDDFLEIPFTLDHLHAKLAYWLTANSSERTDLGPL